ncbi:MAG TPA: sigma-54 dependent transcriptional regulator [Polyangia bacterium]|nr:sigma-54 dependent transcriptional regulator [Polyangia bacterium]
MGARARILVAEDDDLTLELLATVLRGEGHEVTAVADGRDAIDALARETFDCVVGDVQMPRASGLEILEALRARANETGSETPLILVTGYANPGAAMDAIARGAADYLAKPVDVVALRATVARTLERARLAGESRQPRPAAVEPKALIGTSPPMLDLYKQIAQIAPTDTTVLVTGESGSGKELVAREIHRRSARAAGPFVAVNCGGLAESLLESELFGHERGAFTGAHAQRRGLFEAASGGTVFLDEIGDVPLKMQGQLLRVLQEGEIRRVGGEATIPVDVRVVSATNRDLAVEMAEQRLRGDLYYRLAVVSLHVPPLRSRGDDLDALARHLVARHAARLGRPVPEIAPEALARIRAHAWPGNVRELENALARAVAMSTRAIILPEDLPAVVADEPRAGAAAIDDGWPSLDELERRYVDRVLERCGGNKTDAATILGVDRRTLQRLLARRNTDES